MATRKKKITEVVEDTVTVAVAEVKEEANETVGTITLKRWQIALAAVVVTLVLLVIIL
jgi:uncharacterized membrane protein YqjE